MLPGAEDHVSQAYYSGLPVASAGNQPFVLRQNFTSPNISGTSINTPPTVASAAPDDNPYYIVAVAIATSK